MNETQIVLLVEKMCAVTFLIDQTWTIRQLNLQKIPNFYLGVDSFANKQTSITRFYPSGIHLEHPGYLMKTCYIV